MKFHGIDLHSDTITKATIVIENGGQRSEVNKYYLANEKSKNELLNSFSMDDYVLVEASTNTFWFYDLIKNRVKDCYVLDVNKIKSKDNKTDKIDAKYLSKKLAYFILMDGDNDDMPTIYVPEKKIRELRALFSTYQLNKKICTQLKNRIHSLLKQNGIIISKGKCFTRENRIKLNEQCLSKIWQFQIKTLLKELEYLEKETETIKEMILLQGNTLFKEEIKILISIKGFSPFTAIALMSDIIDIQRFNSVKKFCAYLRTAPKIKESNKTTYIGSVNKRSRSLTCTILSQSVNHFPVKDTYLQTFYNRVKIGKSPGKARMAMIRKILVCAYYMLKRKKLFYWIEEFLYNKKIKDFDISIEKIKKNFNEIKKSA